MYLGDWLSGYGWLRKRVPRQYQACRSEWLGWLSALPRDGLRWEWEKFSFRHVELRTYRALKGFPGGLAGKESTCNTGDLGPIPGLRRSPGGGHGNPLQCSWLQNPHGQRSLLGYTPWGHKELDMTERLSTGGTRVVTVATWISTPGDTDLGIYRVIF